jgi:glycosyltransferase involved in cell wall biosynthesis
VIADRASQRSDPPKISVILPVYNGERFLREALESVFAQTETSFELIVGDDGSTDRTPDILAEFADPRMRVLLFEANLGLFHNLNRILREARGPLIHFLCQDDVLTAECLAEDVRFFAAHPDATMSMCQATMVDEKGGVLGQWPTGGEPVVYERIIGLQLFLYHGCVPGNLSTVCVRRSAFDHVGGFDESFMVAGDYEMWVRLCSLGRLANLQKPLVKERHHSRRLSWSPGSGVRFVRENRRVRSILMPLLPRQMRPYAKRYVYLRQNVLDTHHFMTCLRHGRLREARELMEIMGADLFVGVPTWLLTVNNHFYRPKPLYVEKADEVTHRGAHS